MTPDRERVSDEGRDDAASDTPSTLLAQISNEMVRAQKTYFGRGPDKAKSYIIDDFLLIVMRGGFFFFDESGTPEQIQATAEGQLHEPAGEASEELTG